MQTSLGCILSCWPVTSWHCPKASLTDEIQYIVRTVLQHCSALFHRRRYPYFRSFCAFYSAVLHIKPTQDTGCCRYTAALFSFLRHLKACHCCFTLRHDSVTTTSEFLTSDILACQGTKFLHWVYLILSLDALLQQCGEICHHTHQHTAAASAVHSTTDETFAYMLLLASSISNVSFCAEDGVKLPLLSAQCAPFPVGLLQQNIQLSCLFMLRCSKGADMYLQANQALLGADGSRCEEVLMLTEN